MKNKIVTVSIIAVVIALCVGAVIFNHIRNRIPENPSDTVGNTAGNLYNGGLFCERDGYVYFANPYDSDTLYGMNADESDIKKLVAVSVSSLNADDNFIYYYQTGSGGGAGLGFLISTTGVYRAERKNPRDGECLDRIIGKYVTLAGNSVYYTCSDDSVTMNKIGIDGSEKTVFFEPDILPVSVYNNAFYYPNSGDDLHLMTLDLNTGSARRISNEDIYMPIVEGNIVYGIDIHDNYSLVRLNLNDGTKTMLDHVKTDLINVTDTYIYYQTSESSPELRRIMRDGSNMEVVAQGIYTNINATSDYVYFSEFNKPTPLYKTPVSGAVNVTTFDAAYQAAVNELNK